MHEEMKENAGSVVDREMSRLNESTKELTAVAEVLHGRLGSVLRPQPESQDENNKEESLTALPNAIRAQRERVSDVTQLFKSILSRLDL